MGRDNGCGARMFSGACFPVPIHPRMVKAGLWREVWQGWVIEGEIVALINMTFSAFCISSAMGRQQKGRKQDVVGPRLAFRIRGADTRKGQMRIVPT